MNAAPTMAIIRAEDMALVQGDHCAAMILNLLRFWQGDREWVQATLEEIRVGILSAYGKTRIAAAMKLLRFAWRSASAEEGRRWAQIAASVTDPVAAVVEQALADGAEVVNTAVDAMTGIANQGQKFTLLGEASTKLQSIQKTLNALGTNDPRILEANNTIMGWFGALAGGRKVER